MRWMSGSVKEEELEKFGDVKWWDRRGDAAPLHRLNPVRCTIIRNAALEHFGQEEVCLSHPLKNRRVLDVGCGGGILSESLRRLGGDVLGIDVIQRNVEIAQAHAKLNPMMQRSLS